MFFIFCVQTVGGEGVHWYFFLFISFSAEKLLKADTSGYFCMFRNYELSRGSNNMIGSIGHVKVINKYLKSVSLSYC